MSFHTALENEFWSNDQIGPLYRRILDQATECSGFVIDEQGKVNRPVRFADEFNALTAARNDSPLLAVLIGVIAATRFPGNPQLMGSQEKDTRNAFLRRYMPRSAEGQKIVRDVSEGVRTDLMPLMINMEAVIAKNGSPHFLPSADSYAALAQCDLALLYHMAHGCRTVDDEVGMYRFVYAMLNRNDEPAPARIFSPQVLQTFVQNRFLQFAQGARTPLMTPVTHSGLAYRLYVEGALDAHFGTLLVEKQFCEKVAQCTVRTATSAPIRILQPATPISAGAPDRRVFGNTRLDGFLAVAVLDDDQMRK